MDSYTTSTTSKPLQSKSNSQKFSSQAISSSQKAEDQLQLNKNNEKQCKKKYFDPNSIYGNGVRSYEPKKNKLIDDQEDKKIIQNLFQEIEQIRQDKLQKKKYLSKSIQKNVSQNEQLFQNENSSNQSQINPNNQNNNLIIAQQQFQTKPEKSQNEIQKHNQPVQKSLHKSESQSCSQKSMLEEEKDQLSYQGNLKRSFSHNDSKNYDQKKKDIKNETVKIIFYNRNKQLDKITEESTIIQSSILISKQLDKAMSYQSDKIHSNNSQIGIKYTRGSFESQNKMMIGKNIEFEKKKSAGSAQRTSSNEKKESLPSWNHNLISRDQSISMCNPIDADQINFQLQDQVYMKQEKGGNQFEISPISQQNNIQLEIYSNKNFQKHKDLNDQQNDQQQIEHQFQNLENFRVKNQNGPNQLTFFEEKKIEKKQDNISRSSQIISKSSNPSKSERSSKIKIQKLKKSMKKDISIKTQHQNDKNCCVSWKQPVQDKSATTLPNTDMESQIDNIDSQSGSKKLFNLEKELLSNKQIQLRNSDENMHIDSKFKNTHLKKSKKSGKNECLIF